MKDNFNQSDKKVIKLLKQKEGFLLSKEEKIDLKVNLFNKIDKHVTKSGGGRYSIWSYKLNIRGVTMPFIPIIIAVLLASGAGTAVLADNAKPGDFLYPLDQYMERVQEKASMSESIRARFWARVSNERADELLALRKIDPADLSEEDKEVLEQHQEKAIERLAIGIERVEAIQTKFQEKMEATDNENTKTAFQKVLTNLETVKERREAHIEAIETGECPSSKGIDSAIMIAPMPIRSKIQLWRNVSPELRTKIHEQVTEKFVIKPSGIIQSDGRIIDAEEQTDSHQIQSQVQSNSGNEGNNF